MKADYIKVTVIVPTYKGKELLDKCLPALKKQTLKCRILVVDDCSPDDTSDYVKDSFPYVELITLKKNHGFSGAVQKGLNEVNTQFIALLNNDAIPEPNWLEKCVDCINIYNAGSVASCILALDSDEIIDSAGDLYSVVGGSNKGGNGKKLNSTFLKTRETFGACAAAALYNTDALKDCGGFDPGLTAYYDDIDTAFRLQLAGYKCIYCPDAVVKHKVSASYKQNSYKLHRLSSRNSELVWWSNMPLTMIIRYLPEHTLFLILQMLNKTKQKRLMPYLMGKIDAIKKVAHLIKKRQFAKSISKNDSQLKMMITKKWLRLHLFNKIINKV